MKRGYSLYWFSYLYIVASFIRVYNVSFNVKILSAVWLFLLLLQVSIAYLMDIWGIDSYEIFLNYNSVFAFIDTLCCFFLFKSFNIAKGRMIIGFLSPLTFGIYLIHINPATVSWIYQEILPIRELADSGKFGIFFGLIGFTILLFIISAFCEYFRSRLFLILGIENRIYNICQKIFAFVTKYF